MCPCAPCLAAAMEHNECMEEGNAGCWKGPPGCARPPTERGEGSRYPCDAVLRRKVPDPFHIFHPESAPTF